MCVITGIVPLSGCGVQLRVGANHNFKSQLRNWKRQSQVLTYNTWLIILIRYIYLLQFISSDPSSQSSSPSQYQAFAIQLLSSGHLSALCSSPSQTSSCGRRERKSYITIVDYLFVWEGDQTKGVKDLSHQLSLIEDSCRQNVCLVNEHILRGDRQTDKETDRQTQRRKDRKTETHSLSRDPWTNLSFQVHAVDAE